MLDLFSKALQCILPFWTWGRPFCTPPLLLRLWLVLCLHSHCDAVLQGTVCKNKQPINHSPTTKCLIIVLKSGVPAQHSHEREHYIFGCEAEDQAVESL